MKAQWFEVEGPQRFRVLVVTCCVSRVAAVSFGGGSFVNIGDLWVYASAKLTGEFGFSVSALPEDSQ